MSRRPNAAAKSQQQAEQAASAANNNTTPSSSSLVVRCVLCRKPVEIFDGSSSKSPAPAAAVSSSSSVESAASVLYNCAITTAQDFPLCHQCWEHRHISTQQTSLSELSSLVETLNSVDSVNPTALAAFQDVSLEVDQLSHHYVAVASSKNKNKNDNTDSSSSAHQREKEEQEDQEGAEKFNQDRSQLLEELAEIEKKLLSKRSEVLSLQEDISKFKQEEDSIDRRQNGLLHEESSVNSAAQSAGTRLQTAKTGFARLGLSAQEGAALVEATFKQAPPENNNDNTSSSVTSTSITNSIFSTISSLGSCLGAAYLLDVDDTIPRINGRRVGRLQHQNVLDDEINSGCGFLSLLMNHFLQSYTKMEKTGCCMEPQGCQSTITVFVPKRNVVDFHIKRKFFSWSTFGQAWVVFANCCREVVQAMIIALRTKAQKLRSNASFVPGSQVSNVVNRIDDHLTSSQSLPKITASTGNAVAKVDDNNVKYGDANDAQWTAAVNGLFRCLKWCIEAEKFLAD